MDPNVNLNRLLRLAESITKEGNHEAYEDAVELAELFLALNGWIQGGGFLPRLWAQDNGKDD